MFALGATIFSPAVITAAKSRFSHQSRLFSLSGLLLHMMIEGYETNLAKLYCLIYRYASLVILLFEGWAVLKQLNYSGLKLTEYIFILIWIVAAVGMILLLTLKSKAHIKIAILTCGAMAVISVLPFIGYHYGSATN